MDAEARNLQNDFFNAARKARTPVTIYLSNGKKLTGRIKSFDKFTVLIDGPSGELMVFKHAVTTVSMASGDAPPNASRSPSFRWFRPLRVNPPQWLHWLRRVRGSWC